MADNVTFGNGNNATPPAGAVISTEEVTTLNGATVTAQHVQRAGVALITANGTAVDAPGDSANGMLVNLGANNDVTVTSSALPTGAAQDGTDGTGITAPTGGAGIRGWLSGIYQKLSDALAVTQSGIWTVQPGNTANTTPWLVKQSRSSTPTQTSVAASASNVSLLASNGSRLGATIYNDSSAVLYRRLGASASTTNYTVAMAANSYYEAPFNYTGAIDGIWASATGNARITELT